MLKRKWEDFRSSAITRALRVYVWLPLPWHLSVSRVAALCVVRYKANREMRSFVDAVSPAARTDGGKTYFTHALGIQCPLRLNGRDYQPDDLRYPAQLERATISRWYFWWFLKKTDTALGMSSGRATVLSRLQAWWASRWPEMRFARGSGIADGSWRTAFGIRRFVPLRDVRPVAVFETPLDPSPALRGTEDPFYFPLSAIPRGKSYEWKRYALLGEPVAARYLNALAEAGWTAVPLRRHKKLFPTLKGGAKGGAKGRIVVQGMLLMERSKQVTDAARCRELDKAVALLDAAVGRYEGPRS